MALPPPYWLQTNPNRGAAPTAIRLPPKLDYEYSSQEDFDEELELLSADDPTDVYEEAAGSSAEMALWREDGAGNLIEVDTLAEGPRLIFTRGGGPDPTTIRIILDVASREDYADVAELYYVIGVTDAIPRLRLKAAGQIRFIDRLRTVAAR